jgi:hypothetical protein
MFSAYIIVTVVAAVANIYAATNDFIRPKWLLGNMNKLGVPESSLPSWACSRRRAHWDC